MIEEGTIREGKYHGPKPGVGGWFPEYDRSQPGTKSLYKQIGYWEIIDWWLDPDRWVGYQYIVKLEYHVGEK